MVVKIGIAILTILGILLLFYNLPSGLLLLAVGAGFYFFRDDEQDRKLRTSLAISNSTVDNSSVANYFSTVNNATGATKIPRTKAVPANKLHYDKRPIKRFKWRVVEIGYGRNIGFIVAGVLMCLLSIVIHNNEMYLINHGTMTQATVRSYDEFIGKGTSDGLHRTVRYCYWVNEQQYCNNEVVTLDSTWRTINNVGKGGKIFVLYDPVNIKISRLANDGLGNTRPMWIMLMFFSSFVIVGVLGLRKTIKYSN